MTFADIDAATNIEDSGSYVSDNDSDTGYPVVHSTCIYTYSSVVSGRYNGKWS